MQTKQQIQQVLSNIGARPDKKLGQNFLIDKNLINFLLEKAAVTKKDTVLEIGCGTGTLTQGLAQRAAAVVAIEYDKLLSQAVEDMFAGVENVEIINGDALQGKTAINSKAAVKLTDFKQRFGGKMLLVANLPYNIAATAMVNLIFADPAADAMYVTVQKEVAQRMAASPGDSLYGITSVFMEAAGDVKILRSLSPNVFWPPPQVGSAMVEFVRDEEKISSIRDLPTFRAVTNLLMGYRRKTLRACGKAAAKRLKIKVDWDKIFETAQINPSIRAESLTAKEFVKIANTAAKLEIKFDFQEKTE